ncbi:uncharacterized protein LOC108679461 [Hyalella azteca]|uniref:Uncharacterized protein LOC108679461 n=1 Tax=Hyalella azteca TaxID=294128 RepID=A0A8B7PE45_HYAAZ|nr:uncharacterized protein LOC108679461 [Hyalella azteca]
MRVRECQWPPVPVVQWLHCELEKRAIPGPLFAHTLLSLLHPHYCPYCCYCLLPATTAAVKPEHSSASSTAATLATPLDGDALASISWLAEPCASLEQCHKCCGPSRETCHRLGVDPLSRPLAPTEQVPLCSQDGGCLRTSSSFHKTNPILEKNSRRETKSIKSPRKLFDAKNLRVFVARSTSDDPEVLLEEEEELLFGHGLHPDADFPLEPHPKTPRKTPAPSDQAPCGCNAVSRRARKRYKKERKEHELLSAQHSDLLSAFHLLASAADQECEDAAQLLHALCSLLDQLQNNNNNCPLDAPTCDPPPAPPVLSPARKELPIGSKSQVKETDLSCGEIFHEALKYFKAFPALCRDLESSTETNSAVTSDAVWCSDKSNLSNSGGVPQESTQRSALISLSPANVSSSGSKHGKSFDQTDVEPSIVKSDSVPQVHTNEVELACFTDDGKRSSPNIRPASQNIDKYSPTENKSPNWSCSKNSEQATLEVLSSNQFELTNLQDVNVDAKASCITSPYICNRSTAADQEKIPSICHVDFAQTLNLKDDNIDSISRVEVENSEKPGDADFGPRNTCSFPVSSSIGFHTLSQDRSKLKTAESKFSDESNSILPNDSFFSRSFIEDGAQNFLMPSHVDVESSESDVLHVLSDADGGVKFVDSKFPTNSFCVGASVVQTQNHKTTNSCHTIDYHDSVFPVNGNDTAYDSLLMGSIDFLPVQEVQNLTDESKLVELLNLLGPGRANHLRDPVPQPSVNPGQTQPEADNPFLANIWSSLWSEDVRAEEDSLLSPGNWPGPALANGALKDKADNSETTNACGLRSLTGINNLSSFSPASCGLTFNTDSSFNDSPCLSNVSVYTDTVLSGAKQKLQIITGLDFLSKKYGPCCVAYTGDCLKKATEGSNWLDSNVFVHGCGMEKGNLMPSATQPVVVGHTPAVQVGDFTVFLPVHGSQGNTQKSERDSEQSLFLDNSELKKNIKDFSEEHISMKKNDQFLSMPFPSAQDSSLRQEPVCLASSSNLSVHDYNNAPYVHNSVGTENVLSSRGSSGGRVEYDASLADDEDETYLHGRGQPRINFTGTEYLNVNRVSATEESNREALALIETHLQILKNSEAATAGATELQWQTEQFSAMSTQQNVTDMLNNFSHPRSHQSFQVEPISSLAYNPLSERHPHQIESVHEKMSDLPEVSHNSYHCPDLGSIQTNMLVPQSSVDDARQKSFEKHCFVPILQPHSLAFGTTHAGNEHRGSEYNSFSSRADILQQMQPSPEMDEAWKRLCESYSKFSQSRGGAGIEDSSEKNIWADLNANNILSSCVPSSVAGSTEQDGVNAPHELARSLPTDEEQILCRTFQSLGLEKIWDTSPRMPDEYSKMRDQMLFATSMLQQQQSNHNMWTPELQQRHEHPSNLLLQNQSHAESLIVNSGHLYTENNITSEFGTSGIDVFLPDSSANDNLSDGDKLLIAGPSGVQAVLPHSSESNFSSVVPRRTNVQEAAEYLKASALRTDSYRSRASENLLTSPRTHFRPIKSQEEQTTTNPPSVSTFTTTATQVQLDLPYQRSNSGTLFLEKDAIEGSPKKYMVYKEPVEKMWEIANKLCPSQESSLIPKFKVVKNEKFCQTDDIDESNLTTSMQSSDSTPIQDSDDESDVFIFQQEDQFLSSAKAWNQQEVLSSDNWKNSQENRAAGQSLWLIESTKNCFGERGTHLPNDSLVDKLGNSAIIWSSEGSPSRIVFRRRSSKPLIKDASASPDKQERVIDTPAARAIWSSDPRTSVTATAQHYHQAAMASQNINPAIKALWSNSPDKVKLACGTISDHQDGLKWNENGAIRRQENENLLDVSSRLPAWTMNGRNNIHDIEKQIPNDWTPETSVLIDEQRDCESIANSLTPLPSSSWSSNAETIALVGNDVNRNLNKEKIWSTNDAAAAAAAVHSVPWGDQSVWSNAEEGAPWSNADGKDLWSDGANNASWCNSDAVWDDEEYLKAKWSRKGSKGNPCYTAAEVDDLALLEEAKQWEKDVSMDAVGFPDSKQEDLEELDPGWQLQDGFVWAQQCGNSMMLSGHEPGIGMDCDDFDDAASLSSCSSSSSSEVVMMPTEDGGTLAVQVEYLDEELYDKIFGAPDLQMAGSLPDLPNNQAGLKVLRERWLPPWRRPCTFFMEGTCRRKHCKFSHDLSTITCRFWQEGSCLKGSECPFLHGYPVVTRRRNRSEGDSRSSGGADHNKNGPGLRRDAKHRPHRLSSFELSSETDFPSLGSASDAKESERSGASSAASVSSGHGGSLVAQQQKKKAKYTPITAAILQSSSGRSRRRRHTHSAQRCSSPDSKEAECSRSIGSSIITAGSSHPRVSKPISSEGKTLSSATGTDAASNTAGKKTSGKTSCATDTSESTSDNKNSKQRHRRHRSKAAASAPVRKDARANVSPDD